MRTSRFLQVIAAVVIATTNAQAQTGPSQAGELPAFRSDAELTAFMRDLSKRWERQYAIQREAETCEQESVSLRSRTRLAGRSGAAAIHGRIAYPSGLPMAGAVVLLTGTQAGNISATDGTYRLDIPAVSVAKMGKLTLEARMIGFRSKSLQLSLSPGDSVVVDFVLCPTALKLDPGQLVFSSNAGSQKVTSVQDGGVDQGGIAKLHGDHLVILRRGRLFTVRIGDGSLEVVSVVNAFAPDIHPDATWYPELLVAALR